MTVPDDLAARRPTIRLVWVDSHDGVANRRVRVARFARQHVPQPDDCCGPKGLHEMLAAAGVAVPFDARRATRTMAALTARIDRRPTH